MSAPHISRRQLAAAAAGAALGPALPRAGQGKPKEPDTKPAEAGADALLEIVKLRCGAHLDEARLKATRQSLRSGLEAAERLRKVKLSPADEPAFVFRADLP